MPRSRILRLVLPALALLAAGRAANAQGWRFPITVSTTDEVGLSPDTVTIGAGPDTTDGWDGVAVEPVIPADTAGGLSIRSIHWTSETGFTTFAPPIVQFRTDLRGPSRHSDPPTVWVLSVGYYGNLPNANLTLSWQGVNSVPQGNAVLIGRPDDFLASGNGGTDMRTHGSITVNVSRGNSAVIEVHVGSTTPLAPFVSVTPPTGTIQVGGQFPLTADIANAGNPVWTVTPANQGGVILGGGTAVGFQSTVAGTYTVTATVTGTQVPTTVSSSATITATTAPVVLPEIDAFSPIQGPTGTHVQILGQRFSADPSHETVLFTGPGGSLVQAGFDPEGIATTTEIDVIVPQSAIDGPIRVTTPQGTAVSAQPFHVLLSQGGSQGYIGPTNPRIGVPGVSYVQLQNGTMGPPTNPQLTKWDASTAVLFNGIPAGALGGSDFAAGIPPDSLIGTPQVIYRRIPAAARSGPIASETLDTGIDLTTARDFTVLQPPVIQAMNPTFWDADNSPKTPPSITLTGFNFEQTSNRDNTLPQVRYVLDYPGVPDINRDPDSHSNSVIATQDSNEALALSGVTHSMTIFPRPSVQTGPLHFKEEMLDPITGQWDLIGEATTPVFTVIRTPQIVGFTPTSGYAGATVVTITGSFFDPSDPLNNVVGFAGLSPDGKTVIQDASTAPVQSVSPDGKTLTVIVPRDALTGPISVTVHGKYVLSTQVFTVLPSVTIVPGFGRIRAGTGHIPVLAIVGGLGPGLDHSVGWSISTTTPDGDPGTLTLPTDMPSPTAERQVYTPPANIPASALDRGLQVTLTATTFYGAATGTQGVGSATYFILPPLDLAVTPAAIVINNLAQFGTQPLTATSAAGIDLTQIQWSFGGDLLMNSTGPGTLSSLTGAATAYTPPPTVDKEPTTGFIRAQIPSLNLSKDIPVTIHQPPLQIVSLTANQTQATAVVNWQLAPGQLATSSLDWGTSAGGPYPNHRANELPTTPSGLGQATLTGLSPSTAYYFQVTATAPGFQTAMRPGNFTTSGAAAITLTPAMATAEPGDQITFTASVANGPSGAGVVFRLGGQSGSSTAEVSLITSSDSLHAIVNILGSAKAGDVLTLTASPSPLGPIAGASPAVSTIVVAGHVAVTVAPTNANVGLGQTQKFTATVTGSNGDQGVTWSVNGTSGGSAALGTVGADGTYTAPAAIPDPTHPTLTIQATSTADSNAPAGTATVVLQPGVVVRVTPSSPNVHVGDTISVFANVTNIKTTGDLIWTVNGIKNGDATVGQLSFPNSPKTDLVIYTPPAVAPAQPVRITAQSVEDNTKADSTTITVLPRQAVVNPPKVAVAVGSTFQFIFQDAASGAPIPNASWQVVEGAAYGTIDSNGKYTAPAAVPDPDSVSVQATSKDDPRITATAKVTIIGSIQVKPAESTLKPNDQVTFTATDSSGTPMTMVQWTISGGLSGVGSIDPASGVYTAPALIAVPTDVTIRAITPAGPGSALVHLVPAAQAVDLLSGPTVRFLPNDARAVDIVWTTGVPSDSTVELGTTPGVYPSRFSVPDLTQNHVVHVTGLLPGATYHYDIRSKAAGRAELVSGDNTFTALGEFVLDVDPHVADAFLLVDNVKYQGTELPRTFVWPIGQQDTVQPAPQYQAGPNTLFVFSNWDDPSKPADPTKPVTVSVPASGHASLKAVYAPQYKLSLDTSPVDVRRAGFGPKGQGYYGAGGTARISAQLIAVTAGQSYEFQKWIVDGHDQAGAVLTLVMDQPHQAVAVYVPAESSRPAVINPASPTVPTGTTLQFHLLDAATNSVIANVSWSIVEGAAAGTVDPMGVYTAPPTLPTPPQATIVATSQDDPNVTAKTIVTIRFRPIAPVAQDQAVTAFLGLPVPITLSATAQPGTTVGFSVASDPSEGTLTGQPPDLTYTAAIAQGDDSFTFLASNGPVESSTATVTVHVARPLVVIGSASIAPGSRIVLPITVTDALPGVSGGDFYLRVTVPPGAPTPGVSLRRGAQAAGWFLVPDANDPLHYALSGSSGVATPAELLQVLVDVPADAPVGTVYWISVKAATVLDLDGADHDVVSLTAPGRVEVATRALGDLNGDGKVDLKDATLSLQIAVGALPGVTDAQKQADDVNRDGRNDLKDTTLLLEAAIGILKLP